MNDSEKVKAARRAYAREWRKKHPERARAINERYWRRKFEQMQATSEQMQNLPSDVAEHNNKR